MLTDEQGAQAIIALQDTMDIEESLEDAKVGWDAMSEADKLNTEHAHEIMCGGFAKRDYITCKFCKEMVPGNTVRKHTNGWVCEKCWDERLKITA